MFTTRPEIRGTKAVVASTHWLATMAGWSMIEAGGNAFDAAVATGLALHIVEPHQCGFGGDMPVILQRGGSDRVEVICGQGVAPQAATSDAFQARGIDMIPGSGLLAACVPGTFDAWMVLLRDYGTLELADVMAPAIDYATKGFSVIPVMHEILSAVADIFVEEWPTSAEVYLKNGVAPSIGSLSTNLTLAGTLERLVAEAKSGTTREARIESARGQFYRGFIAEAIDTFSRETEWYDGTGQRNCGLLTGDDLAGWQASVEPSLSVAYRDYEVHKTNSWGQGPVALQQLSILKGFDLDKFDPLGPDFVHLSVEIAKLAFADREAWYGDPERFDVPMTDLLSDAYSSVRRDTISDMASTGLVPGHPGGRVAALPDYVLAAYKAGAGDHGGVADGVVGDPTRGTSRRSDKTDIGDTVHLDVVDADGNMVSCMPSGGWLQSSPVIPSLGFCLGSRMQMFWLEPGFPASLAPGARPRTTLSPGLATKDGKAALAFGSPGGDQQDQWALTTFLRHIHHGYDLQAACDAPAFHSNHMPSSFYPRRPQPGVIEIEGRFPAATIDELRRRGHQIELVGDWELGRMTAVGIEQSPEGTIVKGAAQPRSAQAYAVGR